MLNNDLLLLSGNDIPFRGARINIHQPKISEISFIGEEAFHIGSRFLLFDKNTLLEQGESGLENKSNFNIFMTIINSKQVVKHKTDAMMVLTLMFPDIKIKIEKEKILLQKDDSNIESSITDYNFDEFQDIVRQMFCLDSIDGSAKYNPADAYAKKIADKLKKRQQKLAEKKGQKEKEKVNIFSRYISILSVGLKKDMNELLNYTVYQLNDEFKRFQLKQDFDIYIKAKMAGASDLEEVDNWMEELHP